MGDVTMYTPSLCELRNRLYPCLFQCHDMRSTRVIPAFQRYPILATRAVDDSCYSRVRCGDARWGRAGSGMGDGGGTGRCGRPINQILDRLSGQEASPATAVAFESPIEQRISLRRDVRLQTESLLYRLEYPASFSKIHDILSRTAF